MKYKTTLYNLLLFLFITPLFYSCNPGMLSGNLQPYFPFNMQQSNTQSTVTAPKQQVVGEQKEEGMEGEPIQQQQDKPRYITYDDYVGVRDNFSGYVNSGLEAPKGSCHNYVDETSVADALSAGYGNTFDWIAEYMKGGSYKFPKPKTGRDHDSICQSINTIVDQDNLESHTDDLVPQASDCTYASYIGTLIMLKKNNPELFERNRDSFHCRGTPPPCSKSRCTRYSGNLGLFAREPLTWMKKTLGRGNYKTIPRRNIMKSYESGMPKKGDLVNIFRNPSGHSVIFDRIENGKFCYWSSNQSTRGMGTRCESLSRFQNITVGSL